MKRLLLLFFVLLTTGSFAQTFTLKGSVTAAKDGLTLTGVTVVVKGANRGAITDGQGNYNISVRNGETVSFSFIGMESQSIVASSSQKVLNIKLVESVSSLDEI